MRSWSNKEKTLLVEYIKSGKTYEEIAKSLNRTCHSVKRKSQKLGLKRTYIGERFNHLVILEIFTRNNITFAKCLCDCGNIYENKLTFIKRYMIKSCGCLKRKNAHRIGKFNKKHGLSDHPLYKIWIEIRRNDKYTVCDEWKNSFTTFYKWAINNGYNQDCHFLILLNNHSEYNPSSCKWSDKNKYEFELANKTITIDGITKTIEQWTNHSKCRVNKKVIANRLKRNWIPKDAIYTSYKTNRHGLYQQQGDLSKWLNSFEYIFYENQYILDGKEIDLYCEDLKLGIEYCGIYWHNEKSPQPRLRNYHYNKYKACLSKGIRLITIFSDEWCNRNMQVKGFLKSVLNANNVIYGRKCLPIVIDKECGKNFIDLHHIQGQNRKALIYFGLLYDDELVGCLSLNYHHRNTNNQRIVLDRLCFKNGITVIGGASKLFAMAIDWCKKHNYNQIISWSDNRWSNGNIYNKLGFILDGEIGPDYSYVKVSNPISRIPKQRMQKSKISCPDNMTEKEYCELLGFARIWDCGKKRYIYQIY